ncbi:uncharacterized protein [Littorina saxatilis]|uniref:uncharacterized protein n=1 Tax=Littorina saxatilis TaxID=31220 RepID=UPI0038B6761B
MMADNGPVKSESGEEDQDDITNPTATTAARDSSGAEESIETQSSSLPANRDDGTTNIVTRTSVMQASSHSQVTTDSHLNGCLSSPAIRSTHVPDCLNKRYERNSSSLQAVVTQGNPTAAASVFHSKNEAGASCSHDRSGMHLNGLVSVFSHNPSLVTSQTNFLSGSSRVVNGGGGFSHDLSTDDNFDLAAPDIGSAMGQSHQCHKGTRPKKLRRRLRRDDRHHSAALSDSEEEGAKFQGGISVVRPNVVDCSHMGGRPRNAGQCNGEMSPPVPQRDQGGFNQPVALRRDDDLVDEGAVCDFDRNVLVDENLVYTEDTSIPSPEDGGNERSNFPNGHALHGSPLLHHHRNGGQRRYFPYRGCNSSDSEDGLYRRGAVGRRNESHAEEDNGDFIDADLPASSRQLLSSSADSASLSSVNGDLAEQAIAPYPNRPEHVSSQLENDLSGGSDKELNHNQDSPSGLQPLRDGATVRTSYSSPSHDGGFDNFLLPRDLSSSEGVFWNSSESENEDELSEGAPADNKMCQEVPVTSSEGAGVAEALVAPSHNEHSRVGEPQFGAGGDLTMCFHFDRACCLQENQWPMPSCVPHAFLAGHSAARHCPHPHLPSDSPLEGEAGGACAPPPPVNNLSRLHPASRSGEAMANGLDDVAPSNFNDESNRQQKVFDKFPMVEEGRDGDCGSGAGPGKCDDNNVMYPCPVAPAPGIMYERAGDRVSLQDQATLGTLGPNVESFRRPDYKSPFGDAPWRANSESGVSEPVYDESYGYRLCPSADCCMAHNSLHQPTTKGGKDGKKKRIVCRPIENGMYSLPSVERIMIWSEYEAYLLQVKQIGMSACGQTAVLNLLKAFELVAEKEDVCNTIQVNMRKEKASVAEYLASRAVAGTTAEDLLSGVERLTKGEIRGRFFQLWPPRNVQLLTWLSQWMKRGAVPIATLNLQQGVKQHQQIPDAWHHQMVYGVGPRGVYLTNPLEIVSEETMMEQLCSDSVLMVRRQDVVSRFQPSASLAPLLRHLDPRWCTMNVLGQVVNVLREHNMPSVPGYRAQVTSHIRIPAVYRAGITLYVRHNTAQWKALRSAPEFPLLSSAADPSDNGQ